MNQKSFNSKEFDEGKKAWNEHGYVVSNPYKDSYSEEWKQWEEGWFAGFETRE